MIKVTNTSDGTINIHGTLCRPDAAVLVTDRQWRVFKASPMGSHWIGKGGVSGTPIAEGKPKKPDLKLVKAKKADATPGADDPKAD